MRAARSGEDTPRKGGGANPTEEDEKEEEKEEEGGEEVRAFLPFTLLPGVPRAGGRMATFCFSEL